jgi:hypothetical protein
MGLDRIWHPNGAFGYRYIAFFFLHTAVIKSLLLQAGVTARLFQSTGTAQFSHSPSNAALYFL